MATRGTSLTRLILSMVRTTATGADGVAGNSLDSAELESNAEVDEPVELRDADDDSKLQVSKDPEDEDVSDERCATATTPHARSFRSICFSKRSAHPYFAASASVRKNVSIARTSSRIVASVGRRSGLGEKILRRSRYAALETGSMSNRTIRSIK
jgi:hypothetical protein